MGGPTAASMPSLTSTRFRHPTDSIDINRLGVAREQIVNKSARVLNNIVENDLENSPSQIVIAGTCTS
jgi:hypothetical protein